MLFQTTSSPSIMHSLSSQDTTLCFLASFRTLYSLFNSLSLFVLNLNLCKIDIGELLMEGFDYSVPCFCGPPILTASLL
ncbi:hypothetical protein EE612_051681 [Oryza sativa]|nr:hypothetical protein EE612_051681 [Oryza sativa]